MPERLHSPELVSPHLQEIKTILEQYRITAAVVGGVALLSYQNEGNVPFVRNDGTIRDIDMQGMSKPVVLSSGITNYQAAQQKLKALAKEYKYFPPVTLEPPIPLEAGGVRLDKPKFSELLTRMGIDPEGNYHLVFRRLVSPPLPQETVRLHKIRINGIPFLSFDWYTLILRYYIRFGDIKPKDIKKLNAFRAKMLNRYPELPASFSLKNADIFLNFACEIVETYPKLVALQLFYWKTIGEWAAHSKLLHSLGYNF